MKKRKEKKKRMKGKVLIRVKEATEWEISHHHAPCWLILPHSRFLSFFLSIPFFTSFFLFHSLLLFSFPFCLPLPLSFLLILLFFPPFLLFFFPVLFFPSFLLCPNSGSINFSFRIGVNQEFFKHSDGHTSSFHFGLWFPCFTHSEQNEFEGI